MPTCKTLERLMVCGDFDLFKFICGTIDGSKISLDHRSILYRCDDCEKLKYLTCLFERHILLPSDRLMILAIEMGSLVLVKYLALRGCKITAKCREIAENGSRDIIKYLTDNKCPGTKA